MMETTIHTFQKRISSIGLGCVTFGREIDQKSSFAVMDYALSRGITLFDTAAAYGAGASELIIGDWLALRGRETEEVMVATKIVSPYTPHDIEVSVDQSLMRLRVDTIELLYLHHWDVSIEKAETLAALDRLIRTGRVKMLGASNFTAQQLQDAVMRQERAGFSPFRFAQNNHNFAVSDITEELQQVCTRYGISIITYSPLGAGFLTGKYNTEMPADSRFARIPGHQQVYFNEDAYRRLSLLQKVASRTGNDPVRLALAWAFRKKGVASVLVGARTTAHIDQAIEAHSFRASAVLNELDEGE